MSNSEQQQVFNPVTEAGGPLAISPKGGFAPGETITPEESKARAERLQPHIDESKFFNGGRSLLPHLASGTVQGAPSIVEQARALKSDPQLIYQFVHDNIDWEPGWGVFKGALGCLMDGQGNSFDQSMLMVALLRQSGFTANYVLGTIRLTVAQASAWFGTQSTLAAVENYASAFAIPWSWVNVGGTLYIQLSHVWVQCVISGTTYVFDPSFKSYNRTTASLTNIGTTIGYTQSALLADAESGATIDPSGNYVQHWNRGKIATDLTTYAKNLQSWIKANNPTATIDNLLGGATIVPATIPLLQTSLPYEMPGDTPTIWTGDVPTSYKTTLQINWSFVGINQTFTSDQLAGARLSIWFSSGGVPTLYLNGTAVQSGSAQSPGSWSTAQFTTTHNATGFFRISGSAIFTGQYYIIANAFAGMGRGQADYHQQQLAANMAAGGSATAENVLGESLATMWYTFAAEQSKVRDLIDKLQGTKTVFLHSVGVVGHTGTTPFFDIGSNDVYVYDFAQGTVNAPLSSKVLFMHMSALEGAAIGQMAGATPVVTTAKILDAANAAGDKIYIGTSSNWSGTVSPALSANGYPSSALTNINNGSITQGYNVVIPDHPSTAIGLWSGYGYYGIPSFSSFGVQAIVDFFKGGSSGGNNPPGNTTGNTGNNGQNPGNNQPGNNTGGDPIDMFSGNYIYQRTDMTVGGQPFPYSLGFKRFYNSRNQYSSGPLGRGWTHNYNTSVRVSSDGMLGLGDQYALQGVSTIVELFVALDLMNNSSQPLVNIMTAAMCDSWWIDQIVNNTVVVTMPDSLLVFVLQPDGSYSPPLNSALRLTFSSELYTLATPQSVKMTFNSSGQLTGWAYPSGATVTLTYTSGVLTSITVLGRTLTLTYTGSLITKVSDGIRSIQYAYDSNNNLTTFTDATTHNYTYSYDQPGRMTKFFKPANPTIAYTTNVYDSLSRVKTQSNARSQQWTYFFAGSRSEQQDPLLNSQVYYFNRFGSTVRHINPLGNERDFFYDGLNRQIQILLAEGNETQFTYDSNNNPLTITFVPKPGSGLSSVVRTYTYDPTWAKVKTFKDENGNTTTYNYDSASGNLLTVQQPTISGQVPTTTYTYNARGQVLTYQDQTGIITKYSYDTASEKRLSQIVDFGTSPHLNLTTTYGYDAAGNVNSITDPNNNITSYIFDNERRLTQRTDPTPFSYVTKFSYDPNGNLNEEQRQTGGSPAWQTYSMVFSVTDKLHTLTDPASQVTTWNYDSKDRLANSIDAQSREYQRAYDALDRLYQLTDPTNTISTTVLYTPNGYIKSVEDANSHTTQYTYDGLDRLKQTLYADTSSETNTSYDNVGHVLTRQTRSGSTITYTYDVLNRLATKSPTGQATVTYGYDLADRPTSASVPAVSGDPSTGNFQRFFDTAGRFYKEQYPDGKTVVHQLDSNGNRLVTTWPDGYFVTRGYDQLDRLSTIKLNGASTAAVSFGYDELSRRTSLTFNNGTSVSYTPQLNEDITQISHSYVGSSLSLTYGYNNVHEATSLQISDNTFLWYPSAASTVAYGTANSVNEYPSVGGATYSYDGNANLKSDGIWTFSYDTENHLLTAAKTGFSASYSYDPWQRQSQKTVSSTKTRYIFGDWQRIADYDGVAGTLLNRYVYGTDLNEPLLIVSSSGSITYLYADLVGSIVSTANSSGVIVNKNPVSPFGAVAPVGTPFGLTAQSYDSDTGLYYYKWRYYSPNIGRFLQTDPIGPVDAELNLYTYANNNPVSQIDPLGQMAGGIQPLMGGPIPLPIPTHPATPPGPDSRGQCPGGSKELGCSGPQCGSADKGCGSAAAGCPTTIGCGEQPPCGNASVAPPPCQKGGNSEAPPDK